MPSTVRQQGLQKQMTQSKTNPMAAILSQLLLLGFWLAMIILVAGTMLILAGILSSLTGGAFELPMVTAWAGDVPTVSLVAALLETIILATGLGYVCHQLRRILSTLALGDPFVPANATRLVFIGFALALIEIASILGALVLGMFFEMEFRLVALINLKAVGAVVVLLILAQVFREGARLRESEKMTI